ncbi:conserved hypothetical protein [Beutenbergia cavernae DSM 12333]|uniref:DUF998 domain-containing protein n=1 Tax=Beutenbergia cavernae (strain ATCC BAA-8 / DSM 12333 / CCUG 43141 / JCM 11478 / NBRC 16432 / NCIMB 13614 / HKI 0122) TaxID=471853 RepID=C5BVW0_BEUC1|nr:DUF998 domain-containing protein [Beutenbergia cavernae]ACQ80561.1 conserved hypothetical protein [Beutenbergia cavernae DSM 12333]
MSDDATSPARESSGVPAEPPAVARDPAGGFDTGAAITRSLLGWGVVVGPFYVVVSLAQALTRDGFDLSRHALSQLALGPGGWVQTVNLALSGLMVVAAGIGIARALVPGRRVRLAGGLVAAFGVGMLGAALFPTDPINGFPPGTEETMTASGMLHLVLSGLGFLALGVGAILTGGALARRAEALAGIARASRVCGIVVLVAFVAGAAFGGTALGIALLWLAVLTGWAWLLAVCVTCYRRVVPHPDAARRARGAA